MADPFSIATAAIALAGSGTKIAKTLKDYISTYRKAEKRLRPVIRDVEVMAGVLTQIGTALENAEIRHRCTKQFFAVAESAVQHCRENFEILKSFSIGLADVNGRDVKMSVTGKLSLYFKQQDLDSLRGNMGESKASLNLVIGTLQIIITMRTAAKESAAVEDLKMGMQNGVNQLEGHKVQHSAVGISASDTASVQSYDMDRSLPISTNPLPTTALVVATVGHSNQSAMKRLVSVQHPENRKRRDSKYHRGTTLPWNDSIGSEVTSTDTAGTWVNQDIDMRATSLGAYHTKLGHVKELRQPHGSGTKSVANVAAVETRGPQIQIGSDRNDYLLDRLQDASLIALALRHETSDLIDLRQYGRPYDSSDLHMKYDQAQEIFSNLWEQEVSSMGPTGAALGAMSGNAEVQRADKNRKLNDRKKFGANFASKIPMPEYLNSIDVQLAEELTAEAAAKKLSADPEVRKEEIAAATRLAKEAAEKKADESSKKSREEREQKLKDAEIAKAEAEKKQKDLVTKQNLDFRADISAAPIRLTDAVGRKFSFPYELCKKWTGMETLIKQAFLHIDVLGEHIDQGHYDLTNEHGEIVLPQVWEDLVRPGWNVNMLMWPLPEPKKQEDLSGLADPFALLGLGDLGIIDAPKKVKKKNSKRKEKASSVKPKKKTSSVVVDVGRLPLPPPGFPASMPPYPPEALNMSSRNTIYTDSGNEGEDSKSSPLTSASHRRYNNGVGAPGVKRNRYSDLEEEHYDDNGVTEPASVLPDMSAINDLLKQWTTLDI